jgi:HSP20 family molecular chaperone IbpA
VGALRIAGRLRAEERDIRRDNDQEVRSMSSALTRRRPRWWPELFEDFPWELHVPGGEHVIRVEKSTEEGAYVVRAELPGIDPGKDVEITVQDGVLTVHAERSKEERAKHRSEFRYGSFTRVVPGESRSARTADARRRLTEAGRRGLRRSAADSWRETASGTA